MIPICGDVLVFFDDPLSRFFVFTILLISFPSAVYSIGYLKGAYSKKRIAIAWILQILFVISMLLVVIVRNAFVFLVFWEIMSLVSYFLVVFDTEHEKSISAGTLYIAMAHIGTAFIIVALMLLYRYAHSFDLLMIKDACQTIPATVKNVIFLLFLFGFGTKAGIVPLHIWLPLAHPQAPSHISSIMSGVMLKTAIYGFLRFVIFILGVDSLWWGKLVLALASVSCLTGIIYALVERDLKKLLAYSSVENIGIILLSVGGGILFQKMGLEILAVFALSAGLYHLINHAIFKGLLFLCAGSVYKATGTRDMEKLGGLVKLMPWTSAAFLIGAMALSALPPLNGFIGEWLIFQALFLGALNSGGTVKIFLSVCAGILAFTGGLAAACFVKAFGITFLGLSRSKRAASAQEVSLSMKVPMVFMSMLTLVFGVCAAFIIRSLTMVSGFVLGINTSRISFSLDNFNLAPYPLNGVNLSSPLLALILVSVAGLIIALLYLRLGKKRIVIGKTWGCGYYNLDSRAEYTATAFSKPFRIAFSFFLLPYRKTEKIRDALYQVKHFKYEVFTTPIFKRYIYDPLLHSIFKIAHSLRKLQTGSIHLYIAYIFITIILLIIFKGF
jgi:hydrogenase-4 component B